MAKKVKVRMVRGPNGEAPRPWLIGPPFLPESYALGEDPVDVSEAAAEILLDPEYADEMRGRVFEVVGERPRPVKATELADEPADASGPAPRVPTTPGREIERGSPNDVSRPSRGG